MVHVKKTPPPTELQIPATVTTLDSWPVKDAAAAFGFASRF